MAGWTSPMHDSTPPSTPSPDPSFVPSPTSSTSPLDAVPAPDATIPSVRRARRRSIALQAFGWAAGFAVIACGIYVTTHRLDLVTFSPGPTTSVQDRISVKGTKQFATEGSLLWATVNLLDRPTPLDAFLAWLAGDTDVFPRKSQFGDSTPAESRKQSRVAMDDAKLVARIVAGRRLGATPVGGGGKILEIAKDTPASKLLKVGDVVAFVNGYAVCLQGDVRQGMRSVNPGDEVELGLRVQDGTTRKVRVRTIKLPKIDRAIIGITLGPDTASACRLPFDVTIDTTRVGGPSAGLAMTLAILDRLSPGELTGGGVVAVTGTIEADGSVGQVGGVKQKTIAVKAAGAKLFIVPSGEVALARKHAGSMRVVGVRTLDDALAALKAHGGQPLPN